MFLLFVSISLIFCSRFSLFLWSCKLYYLHALHCQYYLNYFSFDSSTAAILLGFLYLISRKLFLKPWLMHTCGLGASSFGIPPQVAGGSSKPADAGDLKYVAVKVDGLCPAQTKCL
jgi:hypothetical protein